VQVELIAPVSSASAALPRLGLGILAALTPPLDEVIYTDEVVRPFDLARDVKDVDLVGISLDSKTARRGYDIADAYRARGVPVVVGGIHPTACPEEAAAHADAVVVGEAEDVWPAVVDDARRRRLRPFYRPPLPDLPARPSPAATSSGAAGTSRSRCSRRCVAARTRASSAACRRRTVPPCGFVPRTMCWQSSRGSAS